MASIINQILTSHPDLTVQVAYEVKLFVHFLKMKVAR